jgi:cyclopropane fatty-acyl-phospholipid synthase-like methyltransferase
MWADFYEQLKDNPTIEHPVIKYTMDQGMYKQQVTELSQLIDLQKIKTIIEFGCGYGGFCKEIKSRYDITNYTLVDHPLMLAIAKDYLKEQSNINMVSMFEEEKIENNYDLLISLSCISEIPKEQQDIYFNDTFKCGNSVFIIEELVGKDKEGTYNLKLRNYIQSFPQFRIEDKVIRRRPLTLFIGSKTNVLQ